MTRDELQRLADDEARKRGIHPGLAKAMIEKESSWNPNAVSGSGAQGLMQLMPGTAKELGVKNPFDPSENLRGGLDYLKKMQDEFKTPELSLAAYNAGPGNVRKFGGIPKFSETESYVPSVLARAKEYGFNPETANVQPDQQLIKPNFQSRVQQDALSGGEAPAPEEKKQGWLGRIFGSRRDPDTIDEFGNKKPGERHEGIGRKILSFAAPLIFGAFPNPFTAGLAVSLLNQGKGDYLKDEEDKDNYQKSLEQSRKNSTPTDDLKKFQEWSKLTPEEKKQYAKMKESSVNPFSLMNMDYRKQRDSLEDERKSLNEKKSSQGKLRDDEASFRKEFSGNQIVKDYNEARLGMDKIREAFNSQDQTGFNDQSLIFNYMKVLDPGSVVREGEYATASKNASLLEGMGVQLNRVMSGQQLSPEQRAKLKAAAEVQYKASEGRIRSYKSNMQQIAKDSGLDPVKVIPDYDNSSTSSFAPPDLSKFAPDDQEAIQAALKEPNNPKAQAILKHFGIGG